jgi:hypothetical protein
VVGLHLGLGVDWRREQNDLTQSLFDPSTQPRPMQKARAVASPVPKLSLMDALSKKNCLRDYSNPLYFFEQVLVPSSSVSLWCAVI